MSSRAYKRFRLRGTPEAMPDQLLVATLLFAAIAFYSPRLITAFATHRKLRHPHRHLILIFRLWFCVLSLASLWLLFHVAHHPSHP